MSKLNIFFSKYYEKNVKKLLYDKDIQYFIFEIIVLDREKKYICRNI